MRKDAVSIEVIKLIAKSLGEINDKAVFVGGSTVPFYLPEEMMAIARPTDDIDVVIEMINPLERVRVEEQLRAKGFKNDISEGAPICRWKYKGITVDVMSPNEKVFGFGNKWYADGIKNSLKINSDGVEVKILSLPYFIATKLEAFKDRGKNDFFGSHDMEDIVSVFDAATKDYLEDVIHKLDSKISKYLATELVSLLENNEFTDAVVGSVFDRQNANQRAQQVLQRMKVISIKLKEKN
jgi:hypothetical protein